MVRPALTADEPAESRRRIAAGTRGRGVEAWRLRRNVLRRDLRAAVRDLSAIAEQRAARSRIASRRFWPLSEAEAEDVVGPDLLARLVVGAGRN
jgi:hypothetical protein